jgi:hypothetical protein
MAIKNRTTDLLRDPIRRAEELYKTQLSSAIEQISPKQGLSPTAKWLHNHGLTLKEMRERVEQQ